MQKYPAQLLIACSESRRPAPLPQGYGRRYSLHTLEVVIRDASGLCTAASELILIEVQITHRKKLLLPAQAA
jgi:hypothetical protein